MNLDFDLVSMLVSGKQVKFYSANEFGEFRINDIQFQVRKESDKKSCVVKQVEFNPLTFGDRFEEAILSWDCEQSSVRLVVKSVKADSILLSIDYYGNMVIPEAPYLKPEIPVCPSLWDLFDERTA
jgi:hypothetical protein